MDNIKRFKQFKSQLNENEEINKSLDGMKKFGMGVNEFDDYYNAVEFVVNNYKDITGQERDEDAEVIPDEDIEKIDNWLKLVRVDGELADEEDFWEEFSTYFIDPY